jgi:TolA-binding protein
MRKTISRTWVYVFVSLILAAGVVVTGKKMLGYRNGADRATPLLDEKNRTLEEKNRELQDMNIQLTQLREELENSSKQVADLKTELEDTNRALFSTRQKLTIAEQRIKLLEARPAQPREMSVPPPQRAPTVEIPRRPAEPGTYEVLHETPVFENPSENAGRIATIDEGVRVLVVRSVGEWLEIRSKHGNPPGYIRREDAMFVGKPN